MEIKPSLASFGFFFVHRPSYNALLLLHWKKEVRSWKEPEHNQWERTWTAMMPVLIFSCFPEATAVPVSRDAVKCASHTNPPAASKSPPGIKAKAKIMGVSTSLMMIQMITQNKIFAQLSKRLFKDINLNQRHRHLCFTANCWLLTIALWSQKWTSHFREKKKNHQHRICSLQWAISAKHL